MEARGVADAAVLASIAGTPVRYGAIVDTLRQLAVELRTRLDTFGAPAGAIEPSLPRVTTSSLRALELYGQMLALRDGEGLLAEATAHALALIACCARHHVQRAARLDFAGRAQTTHVVRARLFAARGPAP